MFICILAIDRIVHTTVFDAPIITLVVNAGKCDQQPGPRVITPPMIYVPPISTP